LCKGSVRGQIFGWQLGCEPIPIFSMSQPLRIEYPGAVYHVMNRGSDHQKVFLGNSDYQAFLKTVSEAHDLRGIKELLDHFGSTAEFHQYVQSGNEEGLEGFYGSTKQSPVLGGEGFQGKLMIYFGLMGVEHPRYERITGRPSAKRVL